MSAETHGQCANEAVGLGPRVHREWVISCPRCGRWGIVIEDDSRKGDSLGPWYAVLWADPSFGAWRDSGVTPRDLIDPSFGCGFDGPKAMVAWEPVARLHEIGRAMLCADEGE